VTDALDTYPYDNVVGPLLAATMRSQAKLVAAHAKAINPATLHEEINREFSWLARSSVGAGRVRHFMDGTDILLPLGSKEKEYQTGPTRISQLLVAGFTEDIQAAAKRGLDEKNIVSIRSPLAFVFDFLTPPGMPGARAYALLALRNLLFTELQVVPDLHESSEGAFGISVIEEVLSTTWTSLRPRYFSKGWDKFRAGNAYAQTVRHYLAMKGVLYFYFKSTDACCEYLKKGRLVGPELEDDEPSSKQERYSFRFERSPFLEKLPDAGEVVNELLGLPLPIRGSDTIFRGGLKFSTRGGLVMAIHGGPGFGKTSLALGLAAHLAPFSIRTLFITADENEQDLKARLSSLVSEDLRRLFFYKKSVADSFSFLRLTAADRSADGGVAFLGRALKQLKENFGIVQDQGEEFSIPKPCRGIVILDGLHDFFAFDGRGANSDDKRLQIRQLYELVDAAKSVKALVVLTTGPEWAGSSAIDFLVDIAIHLSHESLGQYGAKPDRRLLLSKARHQLCASGTHGLQIAGNKGLRFSPQINYQLDRRSVWKQRLPERSVFKTVIGRLTSGKGPLNERKYSYSQHPLLIFQGSHVFIHGSGSGGKAALALKLAMAPSFAGDDPRHSRRRAPGKARYQPVEKGDKILVVSFLYPEEYYQELLVQLRTVLLAEYSEYDLALNERPFRARLDGIHLYPGHLKPNDLFNRIEWALEGAELNGDPYTCVVIDGIHNTFLQFPEIEHYKLFWPQIYNALRSRAVMTITTHTFLSVAHEAEATRVPRMAVDDQRSEPLRHALVQKTDFHIEVNPLSTADLSDLGRGSDPSSLFSLRVMSAIGQPIPQGPELLWSREEFVIRNALEMKKENTSSKAKTD